MPNIGDKVHVVVPSLSATTEQLTLLRSIAESAGATFVVVANSRDLAQRLDGTDTRYVTSRRNEGFAASIDLGARVESWDWLVVLNDDIQPDTARLTATLKSAFADFSDQYALVHLDGEKARAIPGIFATLANVSMTSAVLRRLLRSQRPADGPTYRSFSAVGIARGAWDALGGLDTRYPFTFEDADFARRAAPAGFAATALSEPAARHLHSVTTSRWIAEVLPVSSYSALEYLDAWYGRRSAMRIVLVLALVIRAPIALLRKRRRLHMRGIVRAIKAIATDTRPSLPEWAGTE